MVLSPFAPGLAGRVNARRTIIRPEVENGAMRVHRVWRGGRVGTT